jgi:hypothetical protein
LTTAAAAPAAGPTAAGSIAEAAVVCWESAEVEGVGEGMRPALLFSSNISSSLLQTKTN